MNMSRLSNGMMIQRREAGKKPWLLSVFCLLSAACCLLPSPAGADPYHYNVIVGDRAAGMGGAYAAIADDPSGLFYNPSGIIYATGTSLSATVNAYNISKLTYKGALGSGRNWERTSSALVPNFFGIVQPLGKGKVGFSYAVPEAAQEDMWKVYENVPSAVSASIPRYVMNVNNADKTYNGGPSYAIKWSDKLALGATLYGHYREGELINNQYITFLDTATKKEDYTWINNYTAVREYGIRPVLGVMWAPFDKMSVGLVASGTQLVWSETKSQTTYRLSKYDTGTSWGDSVPYYESPTSFDKRSFPFSTRLGLAYFPSQRLLVSADFSAYSAVSQKQKEVYNMAVGTEYFFTESIPLRVGFFTDKSNTPAVDPSKISQDDHIDISGVTMSVSQYTRSSSLTLGGSYASGLGKGQPNQVTVTDVEMQNITLFISAGYSY